MSKETVKIILTESKAINGKLRKQGYTLLEGICAKGITADNINKVIQLDQVKVQPEPIIEEKSEERISDAVKE